jgi:hypothetical protein
MIFFLQKTVPLLQKNYTTRNKNILIWCALLNLMSLQTRPLKILILKCVLKMITEEEENEISESHEKA